MELIKAKIALWTKNRKPTKPFIVVLSAALLLLVCLCISIHMRSNIQKKYSSVVYQLQEQTYQHLINMTELFARVDDPTVDVRYKLIPELKAQYTAAASLNSALADGCDKKDAVLSDELIAAFDSAFSQYATAYRTNAATGLAEADMTACIEEIQSLITLRYPPEKSAEDDVVIIDASSGQIQTD